MPNRLWLVEREDYIQYEEYAAFVVAAPTEAEARSVHPTGKPENWTPGTFNHSTWLKRECVGDLKVTVLGEACAELPTGVILAHYNQG